MDPTKPTFKCTTVGATQHLWTGEVYEKLKNNTDERTAVVSFFVPWSNWTWYGTSIDFITEHDIVLYGYVEGLENEWTSFSLKELNEFPVKFFLGVERDVRFQAKKF